MPDATMKIVKVGATPSPPPPVGGKTAKSKHEPSHRNKVPRHGVLKGGKTARAKVKLEGVRDPARSPPTRHTTLKILTEKGADRRRKRISKTVRAMPDQKIRSILRASGLPISDKTPPHIAKEILEGGMEAGMIVSS